ncbi:hypothetical protein C4K22_3699 [Pseudomonas chlororaphis subsp. aurantiaca]|nr:hypothetical protein C4K22_3699 [Pseudomonas chlororaphis subsp. aurantiaca]AZD42778.1 hypothetical protein C4K21_3706 [Pseudomonas chlororaphis subsp. aurantiaca]AZD73929.1 hypothetical protein C4K16_3571 [Pseudomonas chlororaphis subsp. aurantiaca]AZD80159.1 hypothetical protein C4K15_3594 [Pseudomonas chlororaphis subsp. aurantiaca]
MQPVDSYLLHEDQSIKATNGLAINSAVFFGPEKIMKNYANQKDKNGNAGMS